MSRRTKYTVKLGKSGLQFKIVLSKSFEEKTGFTQTYPDPDDQTINRSVRTIKVLTVDGVRPSDVKDIRMIVPWTEVQTSFSYRDDDGVEKMFPVDHEVIGKIFTASDTMESLGFINSSEVAPCDYDGGHYFLTIQKDSKSKTPDPNDIKAYSTIHYICSHMRQSLLVKFVTGEREKPAIIYSHQGCLMLSTLIHSNYKRKPPRVDKEELPPNMEILGKKLVASQKLQEIREDDIADKYEARILEYIHKARIQIKENGGVTKITLKPMPKKPASNDFFSLLADL
jgi:non-homologous end joining protein Ku